MSRRNLFSSSDEHGSFSLGKQRKPPLATLAALQWAADRAGLSYGRFMLGLTVRDELRIQEEYEEWRGVAVPRGADYNAGVGNEAAVGNTRAADSNTSAADNEADGSVFGEQPRVNVDDGVIESENGSDSNCVAAKTTQTPNGIDIHTLRTLLDHLPDEVDEEYYSLILKQGIPIPTLLHEVEIWRGRRALYHQRVSPQKRFMAWLRKKYPEY